jgi:hypothetical protein
MKQDRGELWGMINLLRLNMEKIMTLDLLEQQRRVVQRAQQGAQRAAGAAQQGDEEGDQGLYRIEAFDRAEALEGTVAEGAAGGGGNGGAGAWGGAARSPAAARAQLPGGEGDEGFDPGLQVHTPCLWCLPGCMPAPSLPILPCPCTSRPPAVPQPLSPTTTSCFHVPCFHHPVSSATCRRWLSRSWGCWRRSSRLSPAGRGTARRLMCWQRQALQVFIDLPGRHCRAGWLPVGGQRSGGCLLAWGQWHPCPLYGINGSAAAH